jgi:hypothetical protein
MIVYAEWLHSNNDSYEAPAVGWLPDGQSIMIRNLDHVTTDLCPLFDFPTAQSRSFIR